MKPLLLVLFSLVAAVAAPPNLVLIYADDLYDLETDPAEMTNLYDSAEHTAIREDLRKRLVEWMILERDHLPLPLKPEPKPKPNSKKLAPK